MEFTPLTGQQRDDFERDGFLVVPQALPPAMAGRLLEACDRLYEQGRRADGMNERGFWQLRNCLPEDDVFLELLDWPATVPLVVQLLNHNIQLITSHLVVRPPIPADSDSSYGRSGWHRDGGTCPSDLGAAQPRMFIKIAYWLSDISEPGRGAIRLLPGSNDTGVEPPEGDPAGSEVFAMRCRPGDAVLFENRTMHAVGPNLSEVTRKTLFLGYGYRWLRPMDYLRMPEELLDRCDPVRRQLLGDCSSAMGFQIPEAGEVPLKEWMQEHTGVGSNAATRSPPSRSAPRASCPAEPCASAPASTCARAGSCRSSATPSTTRRRGRRPTSPAHSRLPGSPGATATTGSPADT